MKASVKTALAELKQVKMVARERFSFPGGYQLFIITRDGACLCNDCAKSEFKQMAYDSFNNCNTGWRFAAVEISANLESSEWIAESDENGAVTVCDHCNKELNP